SSTAPKARRHASMHPFDANAEPPPSRHLSTQQHALPPATGHRPLLTGARPHARPHQSLCANGYWPDHTVILKVVLPVPSPRPSLPDQGLQQTHQYRRRPTSRPGSGGLTAIVPRVAAAGLLGPGGPATVAPSPGP